MGLAGEIKRRVQMFFHRDELSRDLEEEMRLHIELRRQRQMDRGLPSLEAARAAHVQFGNVAYHKEKSMMTWGSETVQSFFSDVAYGTRALLRSPAITFVALLSLTLGIGANTAIFSLLDAVLLRSLPVKDPQQLVLLGTGSASGIGNNFFTTELYSYPFYRQLQQKNEVFSSVAAVFSMLDDVHGFVLDRAGRSGADSELMHVNLVSGTYFSMLGVEAQRGRMLEESDDSSQGDHPVLVVSYEYWKRAFAGDPDVLNRKIKLGTTIFNIVGVAPKEFFGTRVGESPDMWGPISMTKSVPIGWDTYDKNFVQSMYVMGRLKPGVSLEQATTNVNLLAQQITRGFSDADLSQKNLDELSKTRVPLTPMANGLSWIRHEFSEPLQLLMGVVALVLLIACANIANLLLARSTARARELAVRQALGARRSRLIRQLLTESMVLSLLGGLFGVGFALIANRVLLRMVSGEFELLPIDIGLNFRLLAFTFAVTVSTAILFGTIPAFRATRLQLTDNLKEGRSQTGAGAKSSLAKVLVVSQVTLSLVLMVGAGLFLHSLVNLNRIDPGFNREGVLRLDIETDALGFEHEDPRLNPLYQEIETRVGALPGVDAASFSAFTFNEGSWSASMLVPGMPNNENISVHQNVVGDGYFKTMQIPLVAGRTFTTADTATSQRVAVITERSAKTLFPAGNPIGRHFRVGKDLPENDFEVIGIVKDVKFGSLQEQPEYMNYLSYRQRPWSFGDFEVRYRGDFNNISSSVQQAIKSTNRAVRITHVTSLDEQVARTMTNQRLVAQLSTFFGLLAVFLSAIGIYGLMSYMVSRRTNEIGIRMALGAARSNVSWMVMREILILVAIGIGVGVPLALMVQRLLAKILVNMQGIDGLSLASAVMLLLLVGLVAGYVPSRRASRVDPMEALRYE